MGWGTAPNGPQTATLTLTPGRYTIEAVNHADSGELTITTNPQ